MKRGDVVDSLSVVQKRTVIRGMSESATRKREYRKKRFVNSDDKIIKYASKSDAFPARLKRIQTPRMIIMRKSWFKKPSESGSTEPNQTRAREYCRMNNRATGLQMSQDRCSFRQLATGHDISLRSSFRAKNLAFVPARVAKVAVVVNKRASFAGAMD